MVACWWLSLCLAPGAPEGLSTRLLFWVGSFATSVFFSFWATAQGPITSGLRPRASHSCSRTEAVGTDPRTRTFRDPLCRSLVKYVLFLVKFLEYLCHFVSKFDTSALGCKTMDNLRVLWESSRNYMHLNCSHSMTSSVALSFVVCGVPLIRAHRHHLVHS